MQLYTAQQVRYVPPSPPAKPTLQLVKPLLELPPESPPTLRRSEVASEKLYALVREDGREFDAPRHVDLISANQAARRLNRKVIVVRVDPATGKHVPMSFSGPAGWTGPTARQHRKSEFVLKAWVGQ